MKKINPDDIRFWIVGFFILRLWGIWQEPLEISHSWRQSLTCMITRNLEKTGLDMLHPEIDSAGEKSGIIGSEFPVYNAIPAALGLAFGHHPMWGRLLNLLLSSLGIWAFYCLLKRHETERVAFYAAMVLLLSCWFAFSRKIMPDTFSVSLVLMGLNYFSKWTKSGLLHDAIFFVLFAALGILSKIPSAILLMTIPVMVYPLYETKKLPRHFYTWIFLPVLPGLYWYFIRVPELIAEYGYELYFPRQLMTGLSELAANSMQTMEKFYFSAFCGFIFFGLLCAGKVSMLRKKEWGRFLVLIMTFLPFFFFMCKAGEVFSFHNYYIIPFVPVMAWLAGQGLGSFGKKTATFLLIAGGIEAVANQQHDFFIRKDQVYKTRLKQICASHIPKSERVITTAGNSPQLLYLANRKGWALTPEQVNTENNLDSLRQLGASLLIVDKHVHEFMPPKGGLVYEDEDFRVVRL